MRLGSDDRIDVDDGDGNNYVLYFHIYFTAGYEII